QFCDSKFEIAIQEVGALHQESSASRSRFVAPQRIRVLFEAQIRQAASSFEIRVANSTRLGGPIEAEALFKETSVTRIGYEFVPQECVLRREIYRSLNILERFGGPAGPAEDI